MKDLWKVNAKDGRKYGGYEISVVRTSFEHGFKSYGWFGKDKISIACNRDGTVPDIVFEMLVEVAQRYCNKLNEEIK